MEIIEGPSPEKYDEVDAQPGGAATTVNFKWSVKCTTTGSHNLSVEINTKNCGSVENVVEVEIVKGCSISIPNMYPSKPTRGKESIIQVTAQTALEGRSVEKVQLYYLFIDKPKTGEPRNETLYWESGGEIEGTEIQLDKDEFMSDKWSGKVDVQSRGTLMLWFVATDNTGEKTTSSLFSLDVQDPDRINAISTWAFWGAILLAVIGIVMIFLVQDLRVKRREADKSVLRPSVPSPEKSPKFTARNAMALGLLLLSVIIVIMALILGWVAEIVEFALG
jgi:hypothetical protein